MYVYYNYIRTQISICFALQPGVLESQGILRQVHWMTQNKVKSTTHTFC